ncbi:MAG: flagellar basal body P-ring formation protein FlgA [Deltaproteobacteria bacterium]|nr:flagellar basal body P-ring formation protein FlgA [Deltaproteobacteria bacterium]
MLRVEGLAASAALVFAALISAGGSASASTLHDGQETGSDEVEGTVEGALERALEMSLDGRFVGEVVRAPSALRKLDRAEFRIVWLKAPREGVQSVVVHVVDDDATSSRPRPRKFFVAVRLRAPKNVLVATRALAPGEMIQDGDLIFERRAESAGQVGTSLDPRALVGLRVFEAMALGDVVTQRAIELPPPTARGTEVEVVVQRGALTIATRGTLERGTRPGAEALVRIGGGLEGGSRLVRGVLVGGRVLAEKGETAP